MLKKQAWIDEGVKSGDLRWTPELQAQYIAKLHEISATRASKIASPQERLKKESELVNELEGIQPMPVPPWDKPVPPHEQIASRMIVMGKDGSMRPYDGKILPGERFAMPNKEGIIGKDDWQEPGPREEKPKPETGLEYARRYNEAKKALTTFEVRGATDGFPGSEFTVLPKHEEIIAFMQQMSGDGQQQGQQGNVGNPFGKQASALPPGPAEVGLAANQQAERDAAALAAPQQPEPLQPGAKKESLVRGKQYVLGDGSIGVWDGEGFEVVQ